MSESGRRLAGSIFKFTLLVGFIQGSCKVLGFLEKVVLGYFFGTQTASYACYIVAFEVLLVTHEILKGALAPGLLPTLEEVREREGEARGWQVVNSFLSVTVLLLLPAVALAGLFAPDIIARYTGWGREQAESLALATQFFRLLFSGVVFLGAGVITYATLNSYRSFGLPALGDFTFKVLGLGGLVGVSLIGQAWGKVEMGIWGLVCGIFAGCVGYVGVHLIGLGFMGKAQYFRPRLDFQDPYFRRVCALAAPLVISLVFFQGRRLLDKAFAARLVARFGLYDYVAAQDFGYRFIETPYRLLIEPFAIVLLPYFAASALKADRSELQNMLMTSLRCLLLVFVPASVGFYLLRYPVIQVLMERGKFDPASTYLTCGALGYYILGLTLWALDIILQRFYFSLKDTLLPTLLEVFAVLVHVALCYLWMDTLYHEGIALAFTVSRLIKVVLLMAFLGTKVPSLEVGKGFFFLARLGVAVGLMAVPVVGLNIKLAPPPESKLWFEAEAARLRYWSRPQAERLGLWERTQGKAFRQPEALGAARDGRSLAVASELAYISGGKLVRLAPEQAALAWMALVVVEEGDYCLWVHARSEGSEAKLTWTVGGEGKLAVTLGGRKWGWRVSEGTVHLTAGQRELTLRLEEGAVSLDKFLLTNLPPAQFTPRGPGASMQVGTGAVMEAKVEGPAGMLKRRLTVLIGGTVSGLVVFLAAIWLLRLEEWHTVVALLRGKKRLRKG
ncbi:MAG TPA: hypothetical protein EYP85_09415 [Armatimonadetes bacterium]|nr:hypothetical protein [Armatimonadota bacterium]